MTFDEWIKTEFMVPIRHGERVLMWKAWAAALENQGRTNISQQTNCAIALLNEAVQEFKFGNLARWFVNNGKRINECLAQQHHSS